MSKRSTSVIINAAWELGYYLIVIALGFLAPRFIILVYGSEVNGLSSTITQVMNVILLLQAGAATAAIYTLYRPIAQNDTQQLSKSVAVTERFFRKISFIFLGIMLVIAVVTAFSIESELEWPYILTAFVIMGFKSFLDLYYTSKFRVVFTAFQQKFVLSIATLIEQVIYYALVFLSLAFRWHFLWLYFWFFAGCVGKVVYLNVVYNKRFAARIPKYKGKIDESIPGRNYSLINEISHSTVGSSITIMMSFMYGLEEASVYAVYSLVGQALNLVSTSLHSAFAPSFGDLCVTAEKERARKVFGMFQSTFVLFNGFLMMCMLFLLQPFVKIYTQGATDADYLNPMLALLMTVQGLMSAYRIPYNVLVSSLGFFKETWVQPIVTAVASLALSFAFGKLGYAYILVGPIVFYAVNFLYQHFRLKQLVPHLVSHRAFVPVLITVVGLVLTMYLSTVISVPEGILPWIVAGVLTALCSAAYLGLAAFVLDRNNFLETLRYAKNLLTRRRAK